MASHCGWHIFINQSVEFAVSEVRCTVTRGRGEKKSLFRLHLPLVMQLASSFIDFPAMGNLNYSFHAAIMLMISLLCSIN